MFLLFLLAGFSHHYLQTSKWWHFQLLTQSTLQHIWPGTWENQRLSGLMLLTPPYKVCFFLELERKIASVVVSTITMAIYVFMKIKHKFIASFLLNLMIFFNFMCCSELEYSNLIYQKMYLIAFQESSSFIREFLSTLCPTRYLKERHVNCCHLLDKRWRSMELIRISLKG